MLLGHELPQLICNEKARILVRAHVKGNDVQLVRFDDVCQNVVKKCTQYVA